MENKANQITQLLDLCDRVEVLRELVHTPDKRLDENTFDALMTPYYPCLEQFFHDVKEDNGVTSIAVEITENQARFTTIHADNTCIGYVYDTLDEEAMN